MSWLEFKDNVSGWTGISEDALHIHASLALYMLAILVMRRPLKSPWPWLVVLVFEVINEAIDLRANYLDDRHWRWAEGFHDLWNTMLWPTLIFVALRYVLKGRTI